MDDVFWVEFDPLFGNLKSTDLLLRVCQSIKFRNVVEGSGRDT